MNQAIEKANKHLIEQLSYGGIVVDQTHPLKRVIMEYDQDNLPDEIDQMRRLAESFNNLADALEQE